MIDLRRSLMNGNSAFDATPLIAPLDFAENLSAYVDVNIVEGYNKCTDIDKKYSIKIVNTDEPFEFKLPSHIVGGKETISKCIIHRTYDGYDHVNTIDYAETTQRTFTFEAGSNKRYIVVCGNEKLKFPSANYEGIEWMYAGDCASASFSSSSGLYNKKIRFVHYNGNPSFDGLGYCCFYMQNTLEGEIFVPRNIRIFSNITFSNDNILLNGVRYYGINRREYIELIKFTSDKRSNPLLAAKRLYIDDIEYTELPDLTGLTEIPDSVFCNCKSLNCEVVLPDTITSIGAFAFYDCVGISKIEIPNSVVTIKNDAFTNLYNCRYIKIPSSVTTMGGGVLCSIRNANTRVIVNANISTMPSNWYLGPYYTDYNENIEMFEMYQYGGKYIILRRETPPVCGGMTSPYTYPTNIFVPLNSIEDYKTALGWSKHASAYIGFTKVSTSEDLPASPEDDTWWYQQDQNILWRYINNNYINFTDTSTP